MERTLATSRSFLFLLLLLVLTTIACLIPQQVIEVGRIESKDSELIFKDDFSNPQSGWPQIEEEDAQIGYHEGKYQIEVHKRNYFIWANAGRQIKDAHIEAEAQLLEGPLTSEYGVFCRYLDERNFYAALISVDGQYAILKIVNGEVLFVDSDQYQHSPVIHSGTTINVIRFQCAGDSLSLWINDQFLAEVFDDEFIQAGDIGVIVGTGEKSGASVSFDQFSVFRATDPADPAGSGSGR